MKDNVNSIIFKNRKQGTKLFIAVAGLKDIARSKEYPEEVVEHAKMVLEMVNFIDEVRS